MDSLATQLKQLGVSDSDKDIIINQLSSCSEKSSRENCWKELTKRISLSRYSFPVLKLLYETVYPDWDKIPAPVWFPDSDFIKTTNLSKLMDQLNFKDYNEFHTWSVKNYSKFWETMVEKLNIVFDKKYEEIVDLKKGIESPRWFPKAKLNIINSCFKASENDIAIIEQTISEGLKKTSYGELNKLSNRIANSLSKQLNKGDRVAIIMPMSANSIAIYLGIIKAGCCVVSIADSFSTNEIATRLFIADVKTVFTQDQIIHGNKTYSLYEKIIDANAPHTIVLPIENKISIGLRRQDISWDDFLSDDNSFTPVLCDPQDHIDILFSSGTTAEPKAIPWTHTTPIKPASDAYLHLNIQAGDILCWPTNLGWMMGPWSIFASLINNITIALYEGAPTSREFGKFIQDTKVTMLGVIPTLVKSWRNSRCMEGLDWSAIKLFSSTGECSNLNDMLYLMSLAHYAPIIEYCGGTEIGGAYITSTVIQPSAPSAFTTPALGIDFRIIDHSGLPANNGEAVLLGPSIGLSTELLNKNHHQVYFAKMPKLPSGQILRRHGDQIEKFPNGFYRIHGRVDDTMNLSGIKVSAFEIETTLNLLPTVSETAAIAVYPPDGGPSELIIYVALKAGKKIKTQQLKNDMQVIINQKLNPLFKIADVVIVDMLPRTASNKLMRRILQDNYGKISHLTPTPKKVREKKSICLALQGGGAYGAYTWGILDKFLEDGRLEIDAISANSAGSVNAIILANGMIKGGNQGAREALTDFWRTLSQYGAWFSPIRQTPFNIAMEYDLWAQAAYITFDLLVRTFSPYLRNPYNFDLLRIILLDKIDFKNLKKNGKIKLFLSATNVKTGRMKIFENNEITIDSVLASACLPHLSQAVKIKTEYYWDGGYLGNPAIYPLIYNSQVDDIVIIHNNPINREELPLISTDIDSRINEISFNSSLLRELRAIAFITKLIDKEWIKDEYKDKLRRKFIHIIRSDETMSQFKLINKFNWRWEFIIHLYELGRIVGENWLEANFDHLGKKPTIDFLEFLGDDTQTTR